jgi:DNA-binding NtrC family response regulator
MFAEKGRLSSVDVEQTKKPKVLLVDDNDSISRVLEQNGFEVVAASNTTDAFQLIGSQTFNVLLSGPRMLSASDGFKVVSAMRHCNPEAVTLIFNGYPEMKQAAAALLVALAH